MRDISIKDIVAGRTLTKAESRALMLAIISGDVVPAKVAALLTAFAIRGIYVELLDGFTEAACEMAVPLDLGFEDLIDVCGTGGDGKSSFNISTCTAFVLAGAGYNVAKHGNVAVSSSCGSSDVLQALGVKLSPDPDHLRRSLERGRVCFIHAPFFHPGLKRIAPIRQELGFRTVFNALGPLTNPASVAFRLSGVYNLELQRIYGYLLQRRGERFAVVHTIDGYDEVSLTAPARVVADSGTWELLPEQISSRQLLVSEIVAPATPVASARLIEAILCQEASDAQTSVVIANVAVALWCYERATKDLAHYLEVAGESIRSGKAYEALKRCREV